jgi:GNAT superfamily N-acetyltransferase
LSDQWEFLKRNIGNRLTPELAQGLHGSISGMISETYKQAFNDAMKSIVGTGGALDVDYGLKETLGDYTLKVVKLEEVRERVDQLHRDHFAELESVRNPAAAFNPRYDLWVGWERNQQFVLFVLEHGGQIVGNIGVYTSLSKTNSNLVASEQFIYLAKEHRKGWMGMRLLKFAERVLKASGVTEMVFSSHPVKDTSAFYKRAGYHIGGTIHMKVL